MTNKLQKKWMIIGIIWTIPILITWFNINTVQKISKSRQQYKFLQQSKHYYKSNSEIIKSTIKQNENLYHNIESLQIGLLSVNDYLSNLSEKFDVIIPHKIEAETLNALNSNMGSIPVFFEITGSFSNLLKYLEHLEKDHTYIKIVNIIFVITELINKNIHMELNVKLKYRYQIDTMNTI